MSNHRTGPELFQQAIDSLSAADDERLGSANETAFLRYAQVRAVQANTAALVMLAGLHADAHGIRSRELEVWAEVLPAPPLVKCWGKEARRPECAERHTEDCDYADPVPEPKHELLPVGTRVLVSEPVWDDTKQRVVWDNPEVGRISGYDMHRSKYRWQREYNPGSYASHDSWAFVDNRVVVHPDGPECPPPPQPVKREPTGPVVYFRQRNGRTGHIIEFAKGSTEDTTVLVQIHTPGAGPTWRTMDQIQVIHPSEVVRCPNGQTGDECGSGENQCEACLQDEDEAGDEIERSMGLR